MLVIIPILIHRTLYFFVKRIWKSVRLKISGFRFYNGKMCGKYFETGENVNKREERVKIQEKMTCKLHKKVC